METVSLAMVKTFVMFIGELEYDNIFFDNVNPFSGIHYGERLPYPTFSLFFLLAFVCIMPLIIMNLLVSRLDSYSFDNKSPARNNLTQVASINFVDKVGERGLPNVYFIKNKHL